MTHDISSEGALPDASERMALAKQFYEELSETSEVFSDIVEAYGARTLADLFHLHAAIMSNGFIDIWPDSEVPKVLAQLPSADRWLEYANVYGENGLEKRSIFSKAQNAPKPSKSAPDNADDGLTPGQQEALDAFRARNGRNWKSALRASWERARYPSMAPDHAAALQRIRNTLGPEWLAKHRPQELPKAASPDRLEAIKGALQRDGEDPKFLDKVLGTLRAQNVSSLDDQEIDRAFGTVMLANYCTRYVKAARSQGLTVDDVYLGTTMPRDVSTPAGTTPKPESDAGSVHGTVANAALAEERLQALGLDILSNEDVEAWNRAKNLNGALYPDVSLPGWLEQDGFLTKEFYVRDPSGDEQGLYRKAWFGDYAGGDEREIIITDHDGNELTAGSDSPEP